MTKFQKILKQNNGSTPDQASGVSTQRETKFRRILKNQAVEKYEANWEYYDTSTNMSDSKLRAASGVQKTKEELQQDLLWLEGQKQHLNRMQQISSQIGAAKSEMDATSPDSPSYAGAKKRYEDLLRQYPSMSMFEDLESQLSQTETNIYHTKNGIKYYDLDQSLDYEEKSQYGFGDYRDYEGLSSAEIRRKQQEAQTGNESDYGMAVELQTSAMPMTWEDAEYWGYDRAAFDEVERKRTYLEE